MKVKLDKDYRDLYTLSDLERAKAVIKFMKEEDSSTVKEYAEYAIREALKDTDVFDGEIITAEARTAGNRSEGFIECGAYLTDIWSTGTARYKEAMHIRRFKEV